MTALAGTTASTSAPCASPSGSCIPIPPRRTSSTTRQLQCARSSPDEIRTDISSAIGVAGTITSLGALALGLEEYDRERVHGSELTAEALDEQLRRLASVPLEQRRGMRPLDPDRAPVIVGGAVIAREVLAYFELDKLEISERDILDGAALAAAELQADEEGAAPPGAHTCC